MPGWMIVGGEVAFCGEQAEVVTVLRAAKVFSQ